MTTHKLVIAGFGGQGVMLMGQMIAYAGMLEGKEVTWMPAYGPEMRGEPQTSPILFHTKGQFSGGDGSNRSCGDESAVISKI